MRTPSRSILALVALAGVLAPGLRAQEDAGLSDPQRLSGTSSVAPRVEVAWDENITMSAGGATGDQFREALREAFEAAMADAGPAIDPHAQASVVCRVETVYNGGVIAYSARVELRRPEGSDARPDITWFESWLGTLGVQGLHQLFAIGQQCAEDFGKDWHLANPD